MCWGGEGFISEQDIFKLSFGSTMFYLLYFNAYEICLGYYMQGVYGSCMEVSKWKYIY